MKLSIREIKIFKAMTSALTMAAVLVLALTTSMALARRGGDKENDFLNPGSSLRFGATGIS